MKKSEQITQGLPPMAHPPASESVKMDAMTGLPNKMKTEEEIAAHLSLNSQQNHALLLIDIDNFKALSDREGRMAGDEVIRSVTSLLLNQFRKGDIVGRVGADEFAVLMVNVPNQDAVQRKVNNLHTAIQYDSIRATASQLSISVGYAMSGGTICDYGELFQRADDMLYRDKNKGLAPQIKRTPLQGVDAAAPEHRTVMIVDDSSVNRMILKKNLSGEYDILEAMDGQEALHLLEKHGAKIEVIVLDLIMPVMDGFAFLSELQNREEWHEIPVLVATGSDAAEEESRALKLGAWDFVTKPYNMEVLKFRLRNAILRSQMSAFNRLKYLAEYDTLTGIYNKRKFFEMTRDMLLAHPEEHFLFIRLDIEKFKLINSYFSVAVGDQVLQRIAQALRQYAAAHPMVTYGYMQGDVFCLCVPCMPKKELEEKLSHARDQIPALFDNLQVTLAFGLYEIQDSEMSVDRMYDNAILASAQCKGNYVRSYAFYEEAMREKLERENELTGHMEQALESGQFVIYYQPKYSVIGEKPAGAEALVRWQYLEKGMISPGEFIPLFEKNGFISKLDFFVWEEACRFLQKQMSEGKTPLPISINVSRVDLHNGELVEQIEALTKRYQVPAKLLNIEITETAYAENPWLMQQVVEKLQALGFVVMMDDFGSGYSSLNVLKDLPVDVLKIDMRFLPSEENTRAEGILRHVVQMAKALRMSVIVEGVETAAQAAFLREIGCDYIQGYYYAKPMPQAEYERLLEASAG